MSQESLIKYGPNEASLFLAISTNNTERAQDLITQGRIDLNACNTQGRTPLHYAAKLRNAELTQTLINAGANVDVCDNRGWTPLYYAIGSNNVNTMWSLVHANAKLDICDNEGKTPLQCAFQHSNEYAVGLLIARHLDLGASLGHTSAELIDGYSKFKESLVDDDQELSDFITNMLSHLPFEEVVPVENVNNIAQGGGHNGHALHFF